MNKTKADSIYMEWYAYGERMKLLKDQVDQNHQSEPTQTVPKKPSTKKLSQNFSKIQEILKFLNVMSPLEFKNFIKDFLGYLSASNYWSGIYKKIICPGRENLLIEIFNENCSLQYFMLIDEDFSEKLVLKNESGKIHDDLVLVRRAGAIYRNSI